MVQMIRSDLDFILAQIKIAEADAQNVDLIATGLIPNPELPWGLRRVDGSNNNLVPGQGTYGSADQPFPNALNGGTPINEADDGMRFGPPIGAFPGGWYMADGTNTPVAANTPGAILVPVGYMPGVNFLTNNNYGIHDPNNPLIVDPRALQPGDVVDADPRLISNLVVDQTANNPAAVYKALQVAESADPFTDMGVVLAAAKQLATAKQGVTSATTALATANAGLTQAQQALQHAIDEAGSAPLVAAYTNAAAAAELMKNLANALDVSTSALVNALNANGNVPNAADTDALSQALGDAGALLIHAQTAAFALGSHMDVVPAHLAAANQFVADITDLISFLNAINLGDSIVSAGDRGNAGGAAGLADGLVSLVGGLDIPEFDAQIDAHLLALTPDLIAAQNAVVLAQGAVTTAQGNLTTAQGTLAGEQIDLKNTLDGFGVAYEESPNGDFGKATLFIPNVAPDAGLSSPFNGWMTLFGQFFDHGLDLVDKGGFGTVYVPLAEDDPLYRPGSNSNFMALTRSKLEPVLNANGDPVLDTNGQPVMKEINKVTPFVDQNQTYTSNPSMQVFHREYEMRMDTLLGYKVPHATGRLLNGEAGGLATWADVKKQAAEKLGIQLDDFDIHNAPELLVDYYGNFIRGSNGFAQLVTGTTVTGLPITNQATVVSVDVNGNATLNAVDASTGLKTGHAFLDDIAHNANPGQFDNVPGPGVNMVNETPDIDGDISTANGPPQPNGTYDNELLDRHFVTGDGRGNENIGLTAVHNVFHSEHNRQIDLIKNLLLGEAQAANTALVAAQANPDLLLAPPSILLDAATAALASAQAIATEKLAFLNEWTDVNLTAANVGAATNGTVVWDGERLFQAAKFPTEMQYQHLVFEEFARTVQPFVNVFNDYNGQLDAAIVGEFAHTVYRFGHSMLTETVDRLDEHNNPIAQGGVAAPDAQQIGLIQAFLNPVEFTAGSMSAEEMTAAIARGMTRQRGNEIDEFVTEALRNNLVGLPLDLAVLNIARGRETNVASLNEARAEFYAGSSDAQVKPYGSWAEFAHNLKNPISVINFIAAYGTHEHVTSQTTLENKRKAAIELVLGTDEGIVTPGVPETSGAPTDRLDFLHSRGFYSIDNGNTSLGGLNNVDFWIGGLAEKQMAFGGMLGTTFNFVFEVQLENLQNGDRFYYLSRLANLNLTAQLENNKFAEMIDRNVGGEALHLPGNVFKAMDFQLEAEISRQLGDDPEGVANGLDPILGAINGDTKVIRDAPIDAPAGYDKYLQFIGGEHVVLGGTEGRDILIGDEGDDTLWGDGGDDRLEGGIGNDFVFGGDGADIITDQFGDDEIRSQGGDDVVGAGQGVNLIITDTGNDFVWAGDDLDEILLGQGDDFGAGGADEDMLIGGEGNDWLEGGLDNGLMLGDNGDLIQGLPIKRSVDSPIIGHDILVSTGGNQDFDAESGDDIMVGGLGTERFFGQFGFDWTTYKNDPYGVEADMNVNQFAPPSIASSPGVILDRYAQTEGLSGSSKTDFLRGDDVADLKAGIPGTVTSLGLANQGLDQALKDANLDLIEGLRAFLHTGSNPNVDEGEVGVNTFSTGNILLGGQGSDVIEGRGGSDLIDGDRWLNVVIGVTPPNGDPYYEVQGMADIQQKLFSGELKVADLTMVRRIEGSDDDGIAVDVDVAQFSGRRADYLVEGLNNPVTGASTGNVYAGDVDGDGFVTVRHIQRDVDGNIILGPDPADDNVGGQDGTDKLKNIERLFFSDGTIKANDHTNSIATGKVKVTANTTTGELTASLTGAVGGDVFDANGFNPANVTFIWQVETLAGSGIWTNISRITADEFSPVTGSKFTPTAAEAGLNIRVLARFADNQGAVEHVTSDPLGGVAGVNVRPVYDEANAILGPDLGGTLVDGEILLANTFGILEDNPTPGNPTVIAPFTFTLSQVWFNRFNGNPLATDPNDTINDSVTVTDPNTMSVRNGPAAGTVVEVNPADPWTLPNPVPGGLPLPNLTKQFRFTPAANFEGTVVFEFDITDGVTESVPAEAVLDVIPVNDAPVAIGTGSLGTAPAVAGGTLIFTEAQLLAGAFDIDGDNLRIVRPDAPGGGDPRPPTVVVEAPAGAGTVTDNGDGTYTYTAADGYIGPVTLSYRITDGLASVAAGAVINTANGVPVVTPVLRAAVEDAVGAAALTVPVNLLAGSIDPEGVTLNVTGVLPATLTASNGVVLNSPADFSISLATDQFILTGAGAAKFNSLAQSQTATITFAFGITDGVSTSTNTMTMTITGANDAPVANDDSIITNTALGTSFVVPTWALLANDTDPDTGATLSVTALNGQTGLTAALATGNVTVTDTGAAGGTFNYTGSDGSLTDGAAVGVSLAVNTNNVRDEFTASQPNNNNGSVNWATNWVETDDGANVVTGGQIQIDVGNTNELRILGAAGGVNNGALITRTVNLAGATSATLSFTYDETSFDAGETVQVQFAADGATFTTVQTITGASNDGTSNIALTGPFSADAALRFVSTGLDQANDTLFIDNVNIAYTTPATAVNGTGTANILVGDGANTAFNGLGGNDVVLAGGGDDTITQVSTDGRDIIDGGANGTAAGDRYVLDGTAAGAETFNIYTRNAWLGLAGNTAAQIQAGTEIVITRGGTGAASIITELDNVEEITINGTPQTAGTFPNTPVTGDTILVFGNFTETSLNLNTITIEGAGTIDISNLDSDHRIVVKLTGPATIIGDLRPQDVIVLPEGVDPADADTVVTYTGSTTHILSADDEVPEDTQPDNEEEDSDSENEGEDNDDSGNEQDDDETEEDDESEEEDNEGAGSGSGGSSGNILTHVVFAGTSGNDAVFGSNNKDMLAGADGNDTVFGYGGNDDIVAGKGNDEVFAGAGNDIVSGGAGADRIFTDEGDDLVLGGAGNDTIDTGAGNDKIWGDGGRDVIHAGTGDDVIFASGGDGNDSIHGDGGTDTADYSAVESSLEIDLGTNGVGTAESTDSGADVLSSIENVIGGSGNDTIIAGGGVNVMNGGGGDDTFVFNTAASAHGDRIEGFQAGDQIDLRGIFGGDPTVLASNGTFNAAGQVKLTVVNGDTIISGNTDPDGAAEFSITVAGHILDKDRDLV